jgi:flagellar biosynthesis activator protein FlaF
MYKVGSYAYNQTKNLALRPREVEATAFARAAHVLDRARDNVSDYASRVSALTFNQTLWTLIQASVVEKPCHLSAELKANILNLSVFVDRQTFKAIANPTAENIDILVRIDKSMASGLFSSADNLDEIKRPPQPSASRYQRRFTPWKEKPQPN